MLLLGSFLELVCKKHEDQRSKPSTMVEEICNLLSNVVNIISFVVVFFFCLGLFFRMFSSSLRGLTKVQKKTRPKGVPRTPADI